MTNRKHLFGIMIVVMTLLFTGAFRFVDRDCTLEINLTSSSGDMVLEGAEIEVIQIASLGSSGLSYCADFSSFNKDISSLEDSNYIKELTQYIDSKGIKGTVKTTGPEGKVVFDNLEEGVYYTRESKIKNNNPVFAPFVTVLPSQDGKYVKAYPKTISMGVVTESPLSLTVKKIWKDDGKDRPSQVKVALKDEDGIVETVILNDANGWKYVWGGLDGSKTWAIEEIDVPKGYSVSYSTEGSVCTITNTAKLIQTGQTMWPIPVLFFAGTLFVTAGIMLKIIGRKEQ